MPKRIDRPQDPDDSALSYVMGSGTDQPKPGMALNRYFARQALREEQLSDKGED